MTHWLVTGAGGQVGRSVLALAPCHDVTAVGCARAELDVTDERAVRAALAEHRPDVLLNCAAFTRVDDCETEVATAERVNALGPAILADACADAGVRLLHVSTDFVFAGHASRPIPEDAPPEPVSVYGRTKAAGEQAVLEAPGDPLIVRTQWVFGPGPNFVRTMLRLARQGGPLRVVEDQVGRPTWSAALARGLFAAAEACHQGILHLACEGICSWYDFAREIVEVGFRLGLAPKVDVLAIPTTEMPRPAQRPAYAVLGLERARALGIRLPHWRDALAEYLSAEEQGRDA